MTPEEKRTLDDVAARFALRDLSLRYARGVDRRDERLFASVFHPDATVDFGHVYAGPADAFVGMQKHLLAGYELTAHYLVNSLYIVDGEAASGEIYFLAYHRTQDADGAVVTVGGRYLDDYARREGAWKILRRHVAWDHVTTTNGSAQDRQALTALGHLGGPVDDISFGFLPRRI